MMADQRFIMTEQAARAEGPEAGTLAIKTVLLHILDDEFHDQRIETALSLARACSAHVSCVHVTPVEAYVAFDRFGGIFVMNDVMRKIDERNAVLRTRVETRLALDGISWDYQQVTANVASTLLRRAALADLLITAREPPHHDYLAPAISLLGELLQRSRTPLLIPAFPQPSFDPLGVAIIAWDGSIEAANAVRSALGLLALAREVRVIHIPEQRTDDRKSFPATEMLEYLSRHGIHAQLKIEEALAGHASQEVVSGMIVAEASGARASYIVMGGYSHTRISEYVFGGVTRTLLKECPVALVVAH